MPIGLVMSVVVLVLSRISLHGLAVFVLGVLVVAAAIKFWPRNFDWSRLLMWIEFSYLIRFQLLTALFLAVVIPAGYFLAPSIFIGLFDARGLRSFILVVWMAVQLAWTVMISVRMVLVYGPERFAGIRGLGVPCQKPERAAETIQRRAGDVGYLDMTLYGLLAVPCIALLFYGTGLVTGARTWRRDIDRQLFSMRPPPRTESGSSSPLRISTRFY